MTSSEGKFFPWADVEGARKWATRQSKHSPEDARVRYIESAKSCPSCGATPANLEWLYYSTPARTWEALSGRAGWLTVCDLCHLQVDFFVELMN